MKRTFLIIDGNALLHRAWHALPPLSTKDGRLIHAAYGFTSILLRVLKDWKPDYIAVTFDPPGKTFRHESFPAYKAQREKQPQELYDQIPIIKEVVESFGFQIFEEPSYEADDVIGTIVKNLKKYYGLQIIIVTGDLDTLVLVDETTKVATLKNGLQDISTYDEKAVFARYGLRPKQMTDYKALRGDPSDNIAGVPGIGEKTAQELIHKFETLENLYEHLEDIQIRGAQRIKKILLEHKDAAFRSKELVTLQTDVPIKFYYKTCQVNPPEKEKINDIFGKYEFKSLLKRVNEIFPEKISDLWNLGEEKQIPTNSNYHLIAQKESFKNFFEDLKKQKIFAFDTETTGLLPFWDELVGISISWKTGEAYYVQINTAEGNFFLRELKSIFENPNIKKIGHNVKFDWESLSGKGILVENLHADTMIASYLLHPGTRGHNLDNLAFVELGHQMIPIEDLIGKGKNQLSMAEVPIEKVYQYAAEDADYTWQLWEIFQKRLQEAELQKLFFEIEMPLVEVLAHMERAGVAIDSAFFQKMSLAILKKTEKIQKEIYKMAGYSFNIASPQQLSSLLFEKFQLSSKEIRKGKTGLSTAESELEKLRGTHPIIEHILQFREFTKLKNTYLDTLPKLVNKKTHRVHTSFNQTITATGRLSSSNPNLQNIPIRTEIGRDVRKGFIAEKGNVLLSADYSQFELRIAASLSADKKMIDIFQQNKDIHQATAAKINGCSLDKVTPEMRY